MDGWMFVLKGFRIIIIISSSNNNTNNNYVVTINTTIIIMEIVLHFNTQTMPDF